jgi:hypothetical protein
VLKSAGQGELSFIENVFQTCQPTLVENELRVTIRAVQALLVNGNLSPISDGRRFVAISLAEAETLRRIIHIRNERAAVNPLSNVWNINGLDVMLSLRCLPGGNIVTDQSCNTPTTHILSSSSSFTTLSAYESFRYFNCDMYFNEKSLNILLRSLPETTKRERRHFFKNILMCRRRLNKKWMTSPISKIFVISDQFGMLQQRALAVSLRHRIKQKGLLLYDAFCKFNFSGNGYLTPGEVWGGFDFLEIDVTPQDILDFFNAADIDKDGLLNYRDFIESLQQQQEEESVGEKTIGNVNAVSGNPSPAGGNDNDSVGRMELDQDHPIYSPSSSQREELADEDLVLPDPMPLQRQISLTPIRPKGQEELENLRLLQKQMEEMEDLEANKAEDEDEQRIKQELEAEEDEKDRLQEGGRNPLVTDDQITFNFTTGRLPRFLEWLLSPLLYFSHPSPSSLLTGESKSKEMSPMFLMTLELISRFAINSTSPFLPSLTLALRM